MAKRKTTRNGAEGAATAPKNAPKAAKQSKKEAPEAPGKVEQFKEYFDQSIVEMKKVTWPTRKEAVATSAAVLVLVIFMSLFLGIVDLGLSKAIEAILS
ncbi:preprotein translocase subunit SecE [Desulfovibrio ferrophilus]|uniref:Protein translocase subunit SecE n=1 Tax=Desulfovibrio ferrophilus TaxID=241368 RepID=A0A2Z6AV53_9BACT|nr:preprotein translocase subunit SecE [Desulfovibrio ferrophilus]BBD07098.1 preprotein translocase subunit SecE [Desulfovibrio ferrophilus]